MFHIILNPNAGAGRPKRTLPAVERMLSERGIEYQVLETQESWQAASLAKEAAENGIEAVVLVGGDGSLFEVINGLAGSETILYVVPCGTGNDFVRSLPLPKDPLEAFRVQLDSDIRRVDVGAAGDYHFLNVAGSGFDVEVLRQTEAYKKRFHGILPYLLGIVRGIRYFKPFDGSLEIDGKKIEGRFTLAVIANGQYYGGGMRVARKADVFDGAFDVLYVPALPKWVVCLVLPLFMPGWYDILPIVHRVRATSVTIESKGLTVNMDGELRDMDRTEFRLIAGGVKMALPEKVR